MSGGENFTMADTHNAFLVVDEAHATGVFGMRGEGLGYKADLVIGTFGKAFGIFGAYIACSKTIKDYLVNNCGGLIYATALPPSIIAGIDKALDIVPSMTAEREHLQTISALLRSGLDKMGYDVGGSQSQIVPMIIGDAGRTIEMSEYLKSQGFWVSAIREPTVPRGHSRLRFALSAAHKEEDVHNVLNAIADIKTFKVA